MASSIPTTQSALKITGPGSVVLTNDVPVPELKSGDVLVRVSAISLSPVDSKSADMSPSPGSTSGTEFTGIIAKIGAGVAEDTYRADNGLRPVQVGDKIIGGVFGNNPLQADNGAFAQYVAVPARLIWHVPQSMDMITAAALPAALATTGLTLFQYMQLPMPSVAAALAAAAADKPSGASSPKPYVLVHGGGTATGCMAIQVLKFSGFTPIATCGPNSAERAVRLGAAKTFDYKSPTCSSDIREFTGNGLALAVDCITDMSSMALCYEALGAAGGRYVALDAFPLRGHTRRSVEPDWVCTYTQFGGPVAWAAPYNLDSRPEDRTTAEAWYVVAQNLLDRGFIEPHPVEERSGGLAAVAQGMQDVRVGKVQGVKLVYPIAVA